MAKSPCVGVCKYNKQGLCKGCYRSKAEIKAYKKMAAAERRALHERMLARWRARLAQFETTAPDTELDWSEAA